MPTVENGGLVLIASTKKTGRAISALPVYFEHYNQLLIIPIQPFIHPFCKIKSVFEYFNILSCIIECVYH